MINHITKFTDLQGRVYYKVYYNSGRHTTRFENNLTDTMISIILNGICTETCYYSTGKVEYFYPNQLNS